MSNNRALQCEPELYWRLQDIAPMETDGVLYTNRDGGVVFANRVVPELVNVSGSSDVIGQPVYNVLGIEQDHVSRFLSEDLRTNYLIIEVMRNSSNHLVMCSSTPDFDDKSTYIGSTVSLASFNQHHLAFAKSIALIESTAGGASAPHEHAASSPEEAYFTAIINGILVLVSRLAGPSTMEDMTGYLDQIVVSQGWPVRMADQEYTLAPDDSAAVIYSTLIDEAAGYAADMLGRRILGYALKTALSSLPEDVVVEAELLGIHSSVSQLLT